MTNTTDATEVAHRLFAAIEAGDMDSIHECYHPDAQIWHNTDGVSKDREHTMQIVRWMVDNVPDIRYTERECWATSDGFVQRHLVVAPKASGDVYTLAACVIAKVRDGQVTHLYEYFDSVAADAIGAPISD